MYPVRSVVEIIDAALKNAKSKIEDEHKGKEKYQKKMKNRQKLKNKR